MDKNDDRVYKIVSTNLDYELDTSHTKRSKDFIDYTTFGDLRKIINSNWNIFKSRFNSLQEVFKELSIYYQRKNEQRKIVLSALSYPIIVFFTSFIAVFFMLKFVVPMFVDIFAQSKVDLPEITKFVIAVSEKFNSIIGVVILLIALVLGIRKLYSNKGWYQRVTSFVILKIPIVGSFISKIYLAQFTQAFSMLLESKVSLLRSIALLKEMITFYPVQQAIIKIEKDIEKGKSLNESFSGSSIFDKRLITLLKVGEESNKIEHIFKKISQQYSTDLQQQSKTFGTMLEPFIMIFLGAFIAIILVAMYMPMFKMGTVIG